MNQVQLLLRMKHKEERDNMNRWARIMKRWDMVWWNPFVEEWLMDNDIEKIMGVYEAPFEENAPPLDTCCMCGANIEIDELFVIEERPTGKNGAIQRWPYCKKCEKYMGRPLSSEGLANILKHYLNDEWDEEGGLKVLLED